MSNQYYNVMSFAKCAIGCVVQTTFLFSLRSFADNPVLTIQQTSCEMSTNWIILPQCWPGETNILSVISPVHPERFPRDLVASWTNERGGFLWRARWLSSESRPWVEWWQNGPTGRDMRFVRAKDAEGRTVVDAELSVGSDTPSGLRVEWYWNRFSEDEKVSLDGGGCADFGNAPVFAAAGGQEVNPFALSARSDQGEFRVSTWDDPAEVVGAYRFQKSDEFVERERQPADREVIQTELERFTVPEVWLQDMPLFCIVDLFHHAFGSEVVRTGEPILVSGDRLEIVLPCWVGEQSPFEIEPLLACSGNPDLQRARSTPAVSIMTSVWKPGLGFLREVAARGGCRVDIEDGFVRIVKTEQ